MRVEWTRARDGRVALTVRGCALAVMWVSIGVRATNAQSAATASREGVVLRLHPHVGDTLRTRLEQQTEVSAQLHVGGNTPRVMVTSVTVLARTIVQASRASTTTVLTVVDSASVHSTDMHGSAMSAKAERALRGQRLVLQLAEDGTVESARDAHGAAVSRDMAEAMAAMPAVFPHRAIAVGDRWEREMPLPSAGIGAQGSAHVRAEFRLDSLGRHGDLAYLSMRGEIVPDEEAQGMQISGTVAGAMRVDRVRGWMTDSRFVATIRSLVTPPATSGLAPMRFVTRVTQHLKTMDKW
jgi:hypothetical protein